jgi:hypothetical protein
MDLLKRHTSPAGHNVASSEAHRDGIKVYGSGQDLACLAG